MEDVAQSPTEVPIIQFIVQLVINPFFPATYASRLQL